jgi:tetratricopeptide (TPR) repeat protein
MSKNNKNKGKTVQMQPISAERYITERARKLPIDRCLMPTKLFETGIGTLVVIRNMSNGNNLVGIYLLDVFCLGLKNSNYYYNMDDGDLEDLLDDINQSETLIEAPYNEIHNLVYGGIAYAEDLGFKPEKDWKYSQYILEEDSEDIELIEYEFGKNGKPMYISGPRDNPAMIMATLNRSVGQGNYHYISHIDGGLLGDEDNDDDEDDEDYIYADDLMEMVREIGFDEDEVQYFDIDISSNIADSFDLNEFSEEEDNLFGLAGNAPPNERLKIFYQLLRTHPDSLALQFMIFTTLVKAGRTKEADKFLEEYMSKHPDAILYRAMDAKILLADNKPEEALAVFKNTHHFKELYPEKEVFFIGDFVEYYLFQMSYFAFKGDKEKTKMFLQLIMTIDPENEIFKQLEEIDKAQQNKNIGFKDKILNLFGK